MRGMTENLTVGERVAWYRRRRGMSQEVLAGLIGRTADWLQRAENNRIQLDRLSVIRSLAQVLDVSIGDLIGEPMLLDWTADSRTQTVPALRAVLMDYSQLSPLLASSDERQRTARAGPARPAGRCHLRRLPALAVRVRDGSGTGAAAGHRGGGPGSRRRRRDPRA